MKKFIRTLLLFFLVLVSFYSILLGRYVYKMRNFSFVLPKEKTVLLIGDSQTQAAVNDTILNSIKNVSLVYDGYMTIYRRLRLYLESNPQINTVILAFSPHTVSPVKDYFFHDFGYVEPSTKTYLPFFGMEEWGVLLETDPTDVFSALCTPVSFYWNVNKEYINAMGHFAAADYCHLAEDIKDGAPRLVPECAKENYGNSVTLRYLSKIVSYCEEKEIELIGINTPVYHGEDYFDMNNFQKVKDEIFKGHQIWDDMDMEMPDSCRRDVNHLNKFGAAVYTDIIMQRLKK